MKKVQISALVLIFVMMVYGVVFSQEGGLTAKADMAGVNGEKMGTATFKEVTGGVLISADFTNLPPGVHALHIHAAGKCEQPFSTAGGHFNPYNRKHGYMNPEGSHAGDLPNFYAGADGRARFDVLATQVTLGQGSNSLLDSDGSSLVIHADADDYKTDPAGNSGARLACGVMAK